MAETQTASTPAREVDVLTAARNWLARDGRVAIATVVDTWGSAPVPVGGQMAVAADGNFQGSVSGGCIEGEIIMEAEDILASGQPKTLTFGVADETAWRAGLPCGGKVQVFVERIDVGRRRCPSRPRRCRRREPARARCANASRRWPQGGVRAQRREPACRTLPSGFIRPRASCRKRPMVPCFLHALVPPARILIIGATHIGQVLTAARAPGRATR